MDKDREIEDLLQVIRQRDEQIEGLNARIQEMVEERERLRGDFARLRQESQEKIDKLMERIQEINQRLMGGGARKSGFFR